MGKFFLSLALIVFCLAGLIFFVGGSKTFQECIDSENAQHSTETNDPTKQSGSVFFVSIRDCSGVFVDRNESSVTAISTLVIAVFTIALVFVAWHQASIAKNQDRMQRAYIFGGTGHVRSSFALNEEGKPIPNAWVIPVEFANSGQTPAWVHHVSYATCKMGEIPRFPNYRKMTKIVISDPVAPGATRPTPKSPVTIPTGTESLVFYGRYYFTDMLGDHRYCGFAYELMVGGSERRIPESELPWPHRHLRWV